MMPSTALLVCSMGGDATAIKTCFQGGEVEVAGRTIKVAARFKGDTFEHPGDAPKHTSTVVVSGIKPMWRVDSQELQRAFSHAVHGDVLSCSIDYDHATITFASR